MNNSTSSVFIGIGSNLNSPKQQVITATTAVNNIDGCQVVKASSIYTSKPMGPQNQPDYVNAVIEVSTTLSPIDLLDALQTLELNAGRERKNERWGARTLDLDILLFKNLTIADDRLTVPHYGMKHREFVLLPLHEIAPQLELPDGDNVSQLCNNIDHNGLLKESAIVW